MIERKNKIESKCQYGSRINNCFGIHDAKYHFKQFRDHMKYLPMDKMGLYLMGYLIFWKHCNLFLTKEMKNEGLIQDADGIYLFIK